MCQSQLGNPQVKTITPHVRLFFIITCVSYIVYMPLAIGLKSGLLTNAGLAYYPGYLAGGVYLGISIGAFYVLRHGTYHELGAKCAFCAVFIFSIIDLADAIEDFVPSVSCDNYFQNCDSPSVHAIKVVILYLYVLMAIHSIASIIIVTVVQWWIQGGVRWGRPHPHLGLISSLFLAIFLEKFAFLHHPHPPSKIPGSATAVVAKNAATRGLV